MDYHLVSYYSHIGNIQVHWCTTLNQPKYVDTQIHTQSISFTHYSAPASRHICTRVILMCRCDCTLVCRFRFIRMEMLVYKFRKTQVKLEFHKIIVVIYLVESNANTSYCMGKLFLFLHILFLSIHNCTPQHCCDENCPCHRSIGSNRPW